MKPIIIGHRGMGPTSHLASIPEGAYPENTLESFQRAFTEGAEGIEFDVAVTKDGHVVIIHDDELNRNVVGADRGKLDLGLVSDYTLDALRKFNIGHGHHVPSLEEVLDLVSQCNRGRDTNLIINIELKGNDCVQATYDTVMQYVNRAQLNKEDFVFNTFKWDRLRELRELDQDVKLAPNIKTVLLFGEGNVEMPGFKIKPEAKHSPEGLQEVQKLHDEIGCHAFDCVIYDIRPELVELCARNGIGLYAAPSSCKADASDVAPYVQAFMQWSNDLPVTYFKADDAADVIALVERLEQQHLRTTSEHDLVPS